MDTLSALARRAQQNNPTFGPLFRALYEYTRRVQSLCAENGSTLDTAPLYDLCPLPGSRRGSYQPFTMTGLEHVISIDPFKCRTGVDLAEIATHELGHLWQVDVGHGAEEHGLAWRTFMASFGILTNDRGRHTLRGEAWLEWLADNDDLALDTFVLTDDAPSLTHVYVCPNCGAEAEGARDLFLVCQREACDERMVCSS